MIGVPMRMWLFSLVFVASVGACASFGTSGKAGVPDDAICAWVDWGGVRTWVCASPSSLATLQKQAAALRASKGPQT